ncbi:MAG: glutamate-5-semialdehyde dehydrogenase [Candidatus Nomurabacteria bacterium]|nr:MAG: glutamate-5-semialdehyde dehydrogenase [Candidatus Nomurabacteria bacterium]
MQHALERQLTQARQAANALALLSTAQKNKLLADFAAALLRHEKKILQANHRDFAKLPKDYPLADRLLLTKERIRGIAKSVSAVKGLPDPIGEVLEQRRLKNKLHLRRVLVPIGVLGVIYEARPNVTVEVASITLKTGNAVVLKGGSDADFSNKAFVQIAHEVLKKHKLNPAAISLLDPSQTKALMQADGYVDVLIPRGSDRLIRFVRQNATVPVIETGAGVCHTYVEKSARLDWATRIVVNAKTRRPSVCNALDTIVVDKSVVKSFMKKLAAELMKEEVVLYADAKSYAALKSYYPATLLKHAKSSDYGKEFLSLQASVKTVRDWKEGIAFVQSHTSGHSEAIVTRNTKAAQAFEQQVDAAAVYVNTATSFTDGFEFGLGAEIGISTQKLHARGPMALRELTTYKWIIEGAGQIRPR